MNHVLKTFSWTPPPLQAKTSPSPSNPSSASTHDSLERERQEKERIERDREERDREERWRETERIQREEREREEQESVQREERKREESLKLEREERAQREKELREQREREEREKLEREDWERKEREEKERVAADTKRKQEILQQQQRQKAEESQPKPIHVMHNTSPISTTSNTPQAPTVYASTSTVNTIQGATAQIVVRVMEARDLPKMDPMAHPSPYVCVSVFDGAGDFNEIQKGRLDHKVSRSLSCYFCAFVRVRVCVHVCE